MWKVKYILNVKMKGKENNYFSEKYNYEDKKFRLTVEIHLYFEKIQDSCYILWKI